MSPKSLRKTAAATAPPKESLNRFGFSFDRGGAHLARSMMLEDLRVLLRQTSSVSATREDFTQSILGDNCLGKRSTSARILALRHLRSLYGLDPGIPLFRALRYFWDRDPDAQPLLACLLATARDSVLRQSTPFILSLPCGQPLLRAELEESIDAQEAGRFSKSTLQSAVRNIAATWTQSGHLQGRSHKLRIAAKPTPGSIALALLMGYIGGERGESLFESSYIRMLDCSAENAVQLAENASRRGWIVCKRIGAVVEVLFPNLLTPLEQEWIREQS
jgi:hypothetical protein